MIHHHLPLKKIPMLFIFAFEIVLFNVYLFTVAATSEVSYGPTGLPSCVPTSVPSSVPTHIPFTSKPSTFGETNPPTSSPTSNPNIELNNYQSLRIYNEFTRILNNFQTSSTLWNPSFIMGSFYYKGTAVVGSCIDW